MVIQNRILRDKTLESAAYSRFKLSAYSNLYESNIALTECGCGMIGPYKTPWCEMIKCSRDINILHLWYKLTWLQDEIEKRSSYLGKLRRTEEARHLLDLISMTTDEEDLFYPFAKAAMADVFDVLSQYISKDKCAFLWDEGRNSYLIGTLPQPGMVTRLTSDSTLTSSGKKISGDEFFDIDSTEIDYLQHNVFIKLKFTFNTGSVSGKMELEKTYQAEYVGSQWKVVIDETLESTIATFDNLEVISAWVLWKNPQAYNEGDWIDYDGKVYIALGSGNANNMDALLETKDYRHSIHYLLAFPKDWNINMVEPLDTAIFEALIARIIYKWLQYSYPQEAGRYLTEFNEALDKISERCFEMYGQKIVHRIPRM